MKTRHITIAAMAVLACAVSCQKDGSQTYKMKGHEISVSVSDGASATKADAVKDQEMLCSMPFITDSGDTLALDVFIGDMLDEMSAPVMTRGQVITSGNITTPGSSFKTSVFKGGAAYTDAVSTKTMTDVTVTYTNGKWTFVGGPYYWPKEEALTFCSSAPATLPDGVTDLSWNNGGKVTFSYTDTPAGAGSDAANQKDILFAIDTQDRNAHDNTAQIDFHHALTAVKFIKGEIQGCTIETVSLKNFHSSGNAEGIPSEENGLTFTWKDQATLKTYTQSFGSTSVDGLADNASLDPTTDQSCTFMMIPQKLDETASVEIQVKYGSSVQTISVNLGSITDEGAGGVGNAAKLKDWSAYAGKVVTIRVNGAGIKVAVDETFASGVKSDVGVKNTGGKIGVVRATIVADWVDDSGNVYSNCDFTAGTHMTGLPGTGWTLHTDGFYYYTKAIRPGAVTQGKLFTSYTAPEAPEDGLHLEMVIIVQGVEYDPSCAKAKAAWGSDIPVAGSIE